MFSIHRAIGLTLVLFVLSACGGGGSGNSGSGGVTPLPPAGFTVSTSTTGSGSGTISPTSQNVSQGNTTSFTISPGSGSSIGSVSGCGGSLSGSTYTTGPINSNCTVTATFNLSAYYTVTATAGSGGSISPSSVSVEAGETASLEVQAYCGYEIASISGCDGSLTENTYVTGPISGSCSVSATFARKEIAADEVSVCWAADTKGFAETGAFGTVISDAGTIYTTGGIGGSGFEAIFGDEPDSVTLQSGSMFLAAYRPDQRVAWVAGTQGWGSAYGSGVAMQVNGDVAVVGGFGGEVTFGTGDSAYTFEPETLNTRGFIGQYSSSGELKWVVATGGPGYADVRDTATDSAGGTVISGYLEGNVSFGSGDDPVILSSNSEFRKASFIARYLPDGALDWAFSANALTSAGLPSDSLSYAVGSNERGDVAFTGHYWNELIINGRDRSISLERVQQSTMFMARYTQSGALSCAASAGGTAFAVGTGVAVDSDGNVLVSGYFESGEVTFGIGDDAISFSVVSTTAFIARYLDDCSLDWVSITEGPGASWQPVISTDQFGNALVAGGFRHQVRFGDERKSITIDSGRIDRNALFIARFSSFGEIEWVKTITGSPDNDVNGIAVNRSGIISVVGSYSEAITFGDQAKSITLEGTLGRQRMFVTPYQTSY